MSSPEKRAEAAEIFNARWKAEKALNEVIKAQSQQVLWVSNPDSIPREEVYSRLRNLEANLDLNMLFEETGKEAVVIRFFNQLEAPLPEGYPPGKVEEVFHHCVLVKSQNGIAIFEVKNGQNQDPLKKGIFNRLGLKFTGIQPSDYTVHFSHSDKTPVATYPDHKIPYILFNAWASCDPDNNLNAAEGTNHLVWHIEIVSPHKTTPKAGVR